MTHRNFETDKDHEAHKVKMFMWPSSRVLLAVAVAWEETALAEMPVARAEVPGMQRVSSDPCLLD